MNSLREKLTSQTGASITYALLLFLVCAVVSSVVLAAATAASGRMSKAVESDKRYFSVTSTAEFLKNQLDGRAWIRTTKKQGEETVSTELESGIVEGGLLDVISMISLAAKESGSAPTGSQSFVFTPDGDESFAVEAEAQIVFDTSISTDPVMKLTLKNKTTKANDTFNIWMVFTSDIERRDSADGKYSLSVDKVCWNFYNMSIDRSAVL